VLFYQKVRKSEDRSRKSEGKRGKLIYLLFSLIFIPKIHFDFSSDFKPKNIPPLNSSDILYKGQFNIVQIFQITN